jgi:tripartite ATP-independent transporter DctM subunit
VYSLVVAMAVYRELRWSQLYEVFAAAARTTAVVMFLVAASLVSAWLITVADLPAQLIGLLEPLMQNKLLLMMAMMVVVAIVGTAMDMAPTILILTPVLVPIINAAGIDPIYFGVLFVMNNAIGLVTPPVGTVLNVVAGVSKMGMGEVTRGVLPFLIAELAILLMLTLFPALVLTPASWFH